LEGEEMKQAVTIPKNVVFFGVIYTTFFLLRIPSLFKMESFQSSVVTFIVYMGLFLFGTWLFKDYFKNNFKWMKDNKLESVGMVILIYIIEITASLVVSIIYDFLISFFQVTDTVLQNDVNIQNVTEIFNPVIGLFILTLAGPVVEEIFFRLILVSELTKKFPSYIAILISSVAFASIHVHHFELSEFIGVIPHFGLGIVIGTYFYKTKNILFPIIIHVFMNFSGILPFYLN
jgi:membrane protease YdiL (CAAX protease family)